MRVNKPKMLTIDFTKEEQALLNSVDTLFDDLSTCLDENYFFDDDKEVYLKNPVTGFHMDYDTFMDLRDGLSNFISLVTNRNIEVFK